MEYKFTTPREIDSLRWDIQESAKEGKVDYAALHHAALVSPLEWYIGVFNLIPETLKTESFWDKILHSATRYQKEKIQVFQHEKITKNFSVLGPNWIFLKGEMSTEESTYVLYHELGHILRKEAHVPATSPLKILWSEIAAWDYALQRLHKENQKTEGCLAQAKYSLFTYIATVCSTPECVKLYDTWYTEVAKHVTN